MPVPGSEFGRYRIVGRHSFHAAGFVVKAVDVRTEAERDLWLLTPAGVAEPGLRSEIVAGATAVRKVRAPQLVPLHEFGEVGGQPFFARGTGDGVPLRAIGTFGGHAGSAVECIAQIGQALHALHTAGLVDGALGPGRVLVSGGPGQVRARLQDAVLLGLLIRHGVVVGPLWEETVDYRAPEVHAGAPADHRSDIYGLGGLLWTALTGAKPFATYVGHQLDPVPQLAGDSPAVRALNLILFRSLAKDPAARYTEVLDMVDALRLVPGLEGAEVGPDQPADAEVAAVASATPEARLDAEDVVPGAEDGGAPVEVFSDSDSDSDNDEDAAAEPAFLSDGWRNEEAFAPEPLARTALPDDVGRSASDDDEPWTGPSRLVLGLVLVAGLLMLAGVLLVRHFGLVTFADADATDATSIGVVGPQTGGARAIA